MKKIFFLLFVFFQGLSVHSQNRVGNGGHVIICENNKGKVEKATLLDFYEADKSIEESKEKYSVQAQKQILKLKEIAPKLYDQYLSRLSQFDSSVEFVNDKNLVLIKDSEQLIEPKEKNCHIKQLAVRKNAIANNEKRFLINEEYWKSLSETQKAGLVLHEIIYEHFYKLSEMNSVKARKLNRFLFENEKVNYKEFWAFIASLEIPLYP